MKNTDLTNTYRELDRELAILHDQLESHRSFENILFLPTPEKIRSVREKWNDLKTQVENLDTPDNVYRLVKHHLNDFLFYFSLSTITVPSEFRNTIRKHLSWILSIIFRKLLAVTCVLMKYVSMS